jgi:hypothetical protein
MLLIRILKYIYHFSQDVSKLAIVTIYSLIILSFFLICITFILPIYFLLVRLCIGAFSFLCYIGFYPLLFYNKNQLSQDGCPNHPGIIEICKEEHNAIFCEVNWLDRYQFLHIGSVCIQPYAAILVYGSCQIHIIFRHRRRDHPVVTGCFCHTE